MSSSFRWSPVTDLMSLHSAMDRLFSESFGSPGATRSVAIVRAAVPGVDRRRRGHLQRRRHHNQWRGPAPGGRSPRELLAARELLRQVQPSDRPAGRTLGDRATARFFNGVLTLMVPKAQPVKPKPVKIPISGSSSAGEPRQVEATSKK